jgi:predicted SAM-dependent methyltransferase
LFDSARAPIAKIKARLARVPLLRRWYRRYRSVVAGIRAQERGFWDLPVDASVRMAYNVMLRREPDPVGRADFENRLGNGIVSHNRMVEELRGSEEFLYNVRFTSLGHSIHTGRCMFIQSLPRAGRILDLGGTHKAHEYGAMVRMGYPYEFDELVIVDLPADDRHPIYQGDVISERQIEAPVVQTPLGPVSYRYHSMTDLSGFDDESFDLVYMGQSIEHVTEEDGDHVLKEVFRVLAPGGHLALDTPNARITRLQQPEFIDPDHKIEYTFEGLRDKLEKFGFTVVEAKGLNYAGPVLEADSFSLEAVAGNTGIFADARDCYILAFVCAK